MKKLAIVLILLFVTNAIYKQVTQRAESNYSSNEWYESSRKIPTTEIEALKATAPTLIYVYTDWCRFCKQLENELLYTDNFLRTINNIVKVRINPDRDENAKLFMKANNVTGYPTLLVKHYDQSQYYKISPYNRSSGKNALKDSHALIQTIRESGP